MKTLKLFLAGAMALLSITAGAQIKYTNWRLYINNAEPFAHYDLRINEWAGMHWTCKTSNFFTLDVSPSNPRLAGTGDQIVFYNRQNSTFNSIQVANVYNQSDARSKKDIKTLKSGLSTVLGLRPVSYHWKQKGDVDSAESARLLSANATDESTDSVQTAYGPACETQLQYGFLAQEVEKVLPDAVATDETGNKMVNYTAFIPMLVQAVQELQQTVEAQALTIAQLSGAQQEASTLALSNNKILSCTPNPTSGFVTIKTQMEDNVKEAGIIITSMAGNSEKLLTVSANETTATTDVSALPAGIHIVSLYIDGKLADSCRLIKQ